ncbi:MAG: DUF4344 domain-containing metallopeptidase, partial [Allorhizobium sp.]
MKSLKSAWVAALVMCMAMLSMSSVQLKAEELTEEQVQEGQQFVINNAIFILFHEAGHMLVSEFNLPVLGREEDAGCRCRRATPP